MKYLNPLSLSGYSCHRPAHCALTHFVRRGDVRDDVLKNVFYNTDVAPYLGALPVELRKRVAADDVARVTYEFRQNLEDFLIEYIDDFATLKSDKIYNIPKIGSLFDTDCVLEVRGRVTGRTSRSVSFSPWEGAIGFVVKIGFPKLNAYYALKLFFYDDEDLPKHGSWNEIPVAFAAYRAEPRDNNRVHMASIIYNKYMLSDWAGDADDLEPRQNKYKIFDMSPCEEHGDNYRKGRRIDFGSVYKTNYGALTWRGRKNYRILCSEMMQGRKTRIQEIQYSLKSSVARNDWYNACRVLVENYWGTKLSPVQAEIIEYLVMNYGFIKQI